MTSTRSLKPLRALRWLLALGVTQFACSGGSGEQAWASKYAKAVCQRLAQCQPEASYFEASCESSESVALWNDEELAEVDAGRMAFDPQAGQACLSAVASSSCASFAFAALADCTGVFVGLLPNGAACSHSLECDAGYCNGGCPGVCAAFATGGQACSPVWGGCAPPLRCVGGSCTAPAQAGSACALSDYNPNPCPFPSSCVNGACTAPGGPGAACVNDVGGGSSSSALSLSAAIGCQPGLYCLQTSPSAGSCVAQKGDGGSCGETAGVAGGAALVPGSAGGECAPGLVCAGLQIPSGGPVTPGTCLPPADVGGSCTPSLNTGFSLTGCLGGLACVNGACETPPSSGPCAPDPRMPCNPFEDYCDLTSGNCLPQKQDGAPCALAQGGDDCLSGGCNVTGGCWALAEAIACTQ